MERKNNVKEIVINTGQYLRSVQIVKQKNRTYVGIPTNLKKTRKGVRGLCRVETIEIKANAEKWNKWINQRY